MKDNFKDVFGNNFIPPVMQVIIFDKFSKCIYRLHNIPSNWNFLKVAEVLDLQHDPRQYQAFRMPDFGQLCIDDYVYKNGTLQLTSSNCD